MRQTPQVQYTSVDNMRQTSQVQYTNVDHMRQTPQVQYTSVDHMRQTPQVQYTSVDHMRQTPQVQYTNVDHMRDVLGTRYCTLVYITWDNTFESVLLLVTKIIAWNITIFTQLNLFLNLAPSEGHPRHCGRTSAPCRGCLIMFCGDGLAATHLDNNLLNSHSPLAIMVSHEHLSLNIRHLHVQDYSFQIWQY